MSYGSYGGHGRNDRHNRGGRFHKEDCESIRQTPKYQEIKDLFDKGNFSEVRKNLKKHYKEIECLYIELKGSANNFKTWDEKDIIKNAAVISAYAVLRDLKTTQIRRIIEMTKSIHTRVKLKNDLEKIKDEIEKEALRMNMLMAYYAGKNKSVLPLQEVLEPILNWLSGNSTPENFEKVYTFFEAIVAYHRYFGGKE